MIGGSDSYQNSVLSATWKCSHLIHCFDLKRWGMRVWIVGGGSFGANRIYASSFLDAVKHSVILEVVNLLVLFIQVVTMNLLHVRGSYHSAYCCCCKMTR